MISRARSFAAIALLALLSWHGPGVRAAGLRCGAALLGRPDVELNIWNFTGQSNFGSAHHMNLTRGSSGSETLATSYHAAHMGLAGHDGNYYPMGRSSVANFDATYRWFVNPVKAEMASGAEGDTVFERVQFYSLGLMVETKYMEPGSRREYIQNSLTLNPNQVLLIEATEQVPESELIAKYGKIPTFARYDSQANSWSDYQNLFDHSLVGGVEPAKPDPVYQVKVGVSWAVRGQDGARQYPLPLESPTLLIPIERSKYKNIREVGRAGQTRDAAFEETLRVTAFMGEVERILLAQKPEDCWVFGHSLDALRARLYRNKYKMKDYSGYANNPKEKAQVTPLSEFSKLYPADTYSSAVADLVKASKGSFVPTRALEWVLKMRQMRDLILSSNTGETLAIRDFSNVHWPILKSEIDKLVFPQFEKDQIISTLWSYAPSFTTHDSAGDYARASSGMYNSPVRGIYTGDSERGDRNGLQRLRDFLFQNNAIEIHETAKTPPLTVAITEAFLHVHDRLQAAGVGNATQYMKAARLNFCLTSDRRQSGAPVETGAADAYWFVHRDQWVSTQSGYNFGMNFTQVLVPRIHVESICFSAERVAGWIAQSGGGRGPRFTIGPEHVQEYLSNPQLHGP